MTAPLPELILYGRPGCHLCDDAYTALESLLSGRTQAGLPAPAILRRNIEDDPSWHRSYLTTIPVIVLDGRELEMATTTAKIERFLAEALDGAAAR